MKAQIVGLSDILTYKDKKSGNEKEFRNIYIVRKPTPNENVKGYIAASIFLPATLFNLIPAGGFDEKKEYNFLYDSDGRYSYLSDIKEV